VCAAQVERNTIFGTRRSEVEGEDAALDLAVFSGLGTFGTCQCTDDECTTQSATCCVPGDAATFEDSFTTFVQNGMGGMSEKHVRQLSARLLHRDLRDGAHAAYSLCSTGNRMFAQS